MHKLKHTKPSFWHSHHESQRKAIGFLLVVLGFLSLFSLFQAPLQMRTASSSPLSNVADVGLGPYGDPGRGAVNPSNAHEVNGGGIVQCGQGAVPCTIPDLLETIQRFSAYLLKYILLPVAALSIAIAGIWILSGAHKPANIERGKAIIWDVVYGLIIALSAYVIVRIIFKLLEVKGVNFQ